MGAGHSQIAAVSLNASHAQQCRCFSSAISDGSLDRQRLAVVFQSFLQIALCVVDITQAADGIGFALTISNSLKKQHCLSGIIQSPGSVPGVLIHLSDLIDGNRFGSAVAGSTTDCKRPV